MKFFAVIYPHQSCETGCCLLSTNQFRSAIPFSTEIRWPAPVIHSPGIQHSSDLYTENIESKKHCSHSVYAGNNCGFGFGYPFDHSCRNSPGLTSITAYQSLKYSRLLISHMNVTSRQRTQRWMRKCVKDLSVLQIAGGNILSCIFHPIRGRYTHVNCLSSQSPDSGTVQTQVQSVLGNC
jgi:hypothetical protein